MNLEEESLALKFELNAIADLTIYGKSERWVPGFIWKEIDMEHRLRYELACSYTQGKRVLDVACGSGYGSFLLAEQGGAAEVVGFDLDENTIQYGNIRYSHPKVTRQVQDVQQFNVSVPFDVAISFETIEHLNDYEGFLRNTYRALKEKGILIISTPIVNKTSKVCDNPYHKIEWSFNDFHALISRNFTIEKTFIQSIELQQKKRGRIVKLFSKIANVLTRAVPQQEPDKKPVLFSNQLDIRKFNYGYQILVCHK